MISHIHATTIVVSDQDKALDFYVKVLGWDKTEDAPMGPGMRWLTVAPKGVATHISLSLPGWYAKKPSLEMPWGKPGAWFLDPDGNEFFVAEA